jgi:hypothetical protein
MTVEEAEALRSLRAKGWAVVAFNPDELRGANPNDVEEGLVNAGYDVIDAHAKYPDPAYE